MRYFILILSTLIVIYACQPSRNNEENITTEENSAVNEAPQETDTIIIDSSYTFAEAIEGANAPKEVIDELELINVTYISTDNKLHQGQILTSKELVTDIKELFQLMLEHEFVIEKAIPIVAFNWSDSQIGRASCRERV